VRRLATRSLVPGRSIWTRLLSRDWRFARTRLGILFALPLLAVLIGLLAYPMFSAALMSLQEKSLGYAPVFIGLQNYVDIFTRDTAVREVAFNTVIYAAASVALKVIFGLAMAFVLNEAIPARNFFRGWLLLPWIAPVLVTALTWRWMFDQSSGVINFVLSETGLVKIPPAWLATKDLARFALIVANVWRGFPFFGITLLAGLQSIPQELYEAAEMDGASVWQRIRNITLPWLEPLITTIVILSTVWTFNDFTLVWVMTNGGPGYGTHLFVTYSFWLAFRGSRVGYAAAVTFASLPIVLVFIALLAPRMWKEEEV
jgi:multiple sugar transport system permease protein